MNKRYKDMDEFKEKLKDKDILGKITIPTFFNVKTEKQIRENSSFNFTNEQAERNTGTLEQIDTKIQCPKCKKGLMHRAYRELNLLFFKTKSYVGWLCQNKKCHHFIKRADIYKDWGYEYKEGVNLEVE